MARRMPDWPPEVYGNPDVCAVGYPTEQRLGGRGGLGGERGDNDEGRSAREHMAGPDDGSDLDAMVDTS